MVRVRYEIFVDRRCDHQSDEGRACRGEYDRIVSDVNTLGAAWDREAQAYVVRHKIDSRIATTPPDQR